MRHVATLAIILLLASTLSADSIILKDGTNLAGKITAEHPDRVEIELASGESRTVPRADIAVLRKGTSRLDQFRERLAAVKDDDRDGLLDLAAWCDGQKMPRQRTQALRKVIAIAPDCPEARRGLGQCWDGKAWTKDKTKGVVAAPQAGPQAACEAIGLTVTLPKGFAADAVDARSLRARGPERYRVPVLIEVEECTIAPALRFEAKGWSKPVDVSSANTEGLCADRERMHEGSRLHVREHCYRRGPNGHIVRLTALAAEFEDWAPSLEFVVARLGTCKSRPDHVVARLGIGFDLPKSSAWQVQDVPDADQDGPVLITHTGNDATEIALLMYVPLDADAFEDEIDASSLREAMKQFIEQIGSGGDLKNKSESYLGTMPATLWDYEMLAQGVPMRGFFLCALEGDKAHLVMFLCHERSVDRFRKDFDLVRRSFRTNVK